MQNDQNDQNDQNEQREVEDFIKSGKNFGWTQEDVDVMVIKPEIDEKKKRVSFKATSEKVSQKVFYSNSPFKMLICKDHFFAPLDPHKYIFKCKKCDYHYKANTLTHKYDPTSGKIVYRKTLQPI